MKIYDQSRNVVPGACRIGYRGYYLSLSTLMSSSGEGAVIDPVGEIVYTFAADVTGIMRAKRFIDARVRREERVPT